MRTIELLSPAKDLETGIAAIDHGADAVYIGGPSFGARATASNSIEDIEKLVTYAHQFHAKVYVTVNTILYDNEIEQAVSLIWKLYAIHVDALIIQDLGLLECELPPIPLHASTQLNNRTAEKVAFLEQAGFSQVVLARELNLKQIQEIAQQTSVPLEFFIHGALCVCYNGQCYMSAYATKRSGNRGECSQMCRHKYHLEGLGEPKDGYFLSTKDLHLGEHLAELIDAGISSFKIEGRLKDKEYVSNVTAYFRKRIDAIIASRKDLERSSQGCETFNFEPNIEKTFSRGFTDYYITSRKNKIANIRSPKSQGEYIGKVSKSNNCDLCFNAKNQFSNGDGLCFYDKDGELTGVTVNKVINQSTVEVNKPLHLPVGTEVWRNFSMAFSRQLSQSANCRKIPVNITVEGKLTNITFTFADIYGNTVTIDRAENEPAKNSQKAQETLKAQLCKLGDTIFSVDSYMANLTEIPFIPISELNDIRRNACERLLEKRMQTHKVPEKALSKTTHPFPLQGPADCRLNVANHLAEAFYKEHGVTNIPPAFEYEPQLDVPLMTTKYCIRYQLQACQQGHAEPLFISDASHKFRVEFDCNKCEMNIYACK